jgi:putative hydrolase of the HAD superfamily
MLKKPKMIMFDYGNTLLCEPDFSYLRGEEALYRHISKNKNELTAKQLNDFGLELFEQIGVVREIGMELHERQFQRFLYEYLEIELSISFSEAEKILWDNVSAGAIMPNADAMLDFVNSIGIRSGVISNIGWSGMALTERINRMLPRNKFEFIIASSEYMFRKPSPMLFKLALKKAELDADDVWFCGDNIKADVEGSSAVGMFPVWYEDKMMDNPWREQNIGVTTHCEYLHIHDWNELIHVLKGLC